MSSWEVTTTQARRLQIVPRFFRDGLQVEHQVGVGPDELADFIDQEHDPMLRPLGIQVFLDPFAEVLDRRSEKLSSAPSIHFSAAGWLWPSVSLNALTTSSRLNW